jgi:hypothetical protein
MGSRRAGRPEATRARNVELTNRVVLIISFALLSPHWRPRDLRSEILFATPAIES